MVCVYEKQGGGGRRFRVPSPGRGGVNPPRRNSGIEGVVRIGCGGSTIRHINPAYCPIKRPPLEAGMDGPPTAPGGRLFGGEGWEIVTQPTGCKWSS